MISFVDVYECKRKFATLISKLYYSAGLSLEIINDKLIYGNLLRLFEENKVEELLAKQYQDLSWEYFDAELKYDANDDGPIYWAALQSVNISLNYSIPLKQIFLLCPLSEMVAHFDIYHQMNNIEMSKEFLENEYKRSILREIRKTIGITASQLGKMAKVPQNTLKYLEKSNTNLFNSSYQTIASIMNATNLKDISIFTKTSNFVPFSKYLINNESFMLCLKKEISSYFDLKIVDNLKIGIGDSKEINAPYLSFDVITKLYVNNHIYVIEDNIMLCILKNAIKDTLHSEVVTELLL